MLLLVLVLPLAPAGNYFPTIKAALTHSPYWVTARTLAEKANILPVLAGSTPVTLLVPTNTAFKPVEAEVAKFSTSRLSDVLLYHVLPKDRVVPGGFKRGPAPTLLKGHSVNIDINTK